MFYLLTLCSSLISLCSSLISLLIIVLSLYLFYRVVVNPLKDMLYDPNKTIRDIGTQIITKASENIPYILDETASLASRSSSKIFRNLSNKLEIQKRTKELTQQLNSFE